MTRQGAWQTEDIKINELGGINNCSELALELSALRSVLISCLTDALFLFINYLFLIWRWKCSQ